MGVTSHGPVIVSNVDGTQLIGQKTSANSIPVVLPSDQTITVTANSDATATAAAPSYSEGTENPLSQTLTGDLRVVAKIAASQTLSTVSAVTAITNALPAGTNAIGDIGITPRVARLTDTVISFASSGDNTVIAGAAAQTVKVYQLFLVAAAATVVTFKSGAGTSLSGAITLVAGGSVTLDFNSEPWFTTAAAAAFVINSTNAVQISGTAYSVTS